MTHFTEARRKELAMRNQIYTPKFVWLLIVLLQFIVFFDRGAFAGALEEIRQDASISGSATEVLSAEKAGMISSLFMVGFLLGSPTFVGLSGRFRTKTLLIVGMLLWLLTVIFTSVAPDFPSLCAARSLTGLGEACIAPLGIVMVDNIAPPERRTLWVGLVMAQIATGTALGMGLGGVIASHVTLPATPGWRFCFMLESGLGGLFVLLLFFLPEEYNLFDLEATVHNDEDKDKVHRAIAEQREIRRTNTAGGASGDALDEAAGAAVAVGSPGDGGGEDDHGDFHQPIWVAFRVLMCHPEFMLVSVGYAAYDFFVGAIASWLITAAMQGPIDDMTQSKASGIIGGAMLVCGLGGSVVGGIICDRLAPVTHPSCVSRSLIIASALGAVGVVASGVALLAQKMWLFVLSFVPGTFCLIGLTPAITAAQLGIVPQHLRTYCIAVCMVIMHALGDAISPAIAGAVSKRFSGLCENAPEKICEFMSFANATYDDDHAWVDGDCKWMAARHRGDDAFCANTMQLQKALLVALAVSCVMVPCWVLAAGRQRCCPTEEEEAYRKAAAGGGARSETDPLLQDE